MSYELPWANASNAPFRLYKSWVHEGGISTPLIAHWPKGIASNCRGKLDHQPGHLIDVMTRRDAGIIMDIRTASTGDPIMRGRGRSWNSSASLRSPRSAGRP